MAPIARCGSVPLRAANCTTPSTKADSAGAVPMEHGQGRVKALQHGFGGVFLDAALVGPFPGLQRPFDVNLGALLQILLGDLAEALVEDHDAVPLGLFLALAGALVAPGLRRRHAQIGDRPTVLGPPDLRVLAEISDQNHLIYASRHRHSPRSNSMPLKAAARTGRPPRHLRGTLYACRSRNPLVSGFSTYSIGQALVPVLFHEYRPESEPSGLNFRA